MVFQRNILRSYGNNGPFGNRILLAHAPTFPGASDLLRAKQGLDQFLLFAAAAAAAGNSRPHSITTISHFGQVCQMKNSKTKLFDRTGTDCVLKVGSAWQP
jgi:hypothetical protein